MAQFKCGILPLRIETGRYVKEHPQERFCKLCNDGSIEDEKHFLLSCKYFNSQRETFFRDMNIDRNVQININELMEKNQRQIAKFLDILFKARKQHLYK